MEQYQRLVCRAILLLESVFSLSTVPGRAAEFEAARWLTPPPDMATNAPCPVFRKEFPLARKPGSASIRIVGLGDYALRVNGQAVTVNGMNQPWSQYEQTIFYRDIDITRFLVAGNNCVAVSLFNSFWNNLNPPKGRYNKHGPQRKADEPFLLCAEIKLIAKDGSVSIVGTDETWRVTAGPVVFSHVYAGEDFDARRQFPAWDRPRFDESSWPPARVVRPPASRLAAQFFPGIAEFIQQQPVSVKEPSPGVFLYSFPENQAAQLRVKLDGGSPGDRVRFRCGEHRNDKDGLFGAYIVDGNIITDGKSFTRQWESFYLGMQFVEVTGAVPAGHPNPQNLPVIRGIELVNVRAALPEIGSFRCSSENLQWHTPDH